MPLLQALVIASGPVIVGVVACVWVRAWVCLRDGTAPTGESPTVPEEVGTWPLG